jgi:hypothetical protein
MDYINYFYETLYDIYNQWYYVSNSKINIQEINDVEIIKLIKEVENEIRIDKEIKELEDRYINLCKSIKEEDDNDRDNNNKPNNDGAIKIKIKN